MIDRLGGDEQAPRNRRIAQALTYKREGLGFAPRKPVGMMPGRFLRGPRQAADTLGAHPLAQCLRRRRSPKLLENRERFALLRIGSMPGEQARVLIGAAQLLPELRRAAPIARDLPRIRLRDVRQWPFESIDSPQPGRQFAVHARIGPL